MHIFLLVAALAAGNSLELPPVVVEEKAPAPREIHQPSPVNPFAVDQLDAFFSEADHQAMSLDPWGGMDPTWSESASLPDAQLPRPWLPQSLDASRLAISTGPRPRQEPERWEMQLIGPSGERLRTFSGKGFPPASIRWDGRDERGQALRPGLPCATMLELHDDTGQRVRRPGQPFRLEFIAHPQERGEEVLVSGELLFGGGTSISEEGELVVASLADRLRRRAPTQASLIFVDPDVAVAQAKAQLLQEALAAALHWPPSRIAVEAEVDARTRASQGQLSLQLRDAR